MTLKEEHINDIELVDIAVPLKLLANLCSNRRNRKVEGVHGLNLRALDIRQLDRISRKGQTVPSNVLQNLPSARCSMCGPGATERSKVPTQPSVKN